MSTDVEREWFEDWVPIDLGDGEHRVGWTDSLGGRDLYWIHSCKGGRRQLATIDVSSGKRHHLTNDDPEHLTVEGSVLCVECQDHGFVRDGKWVSA